MRIMNTVTVQKQSIVVQNFEKGNTSRKEAVRSLVTLGMLPDLAEASLFGEEVIVPMRGLASVLFLPQ